MIRKIFNTLLGGYYQRPKIRAHSSHPEDPRHWHDPRDPLQVVRKERAEQKRYRREVKRSSDMARSFINNPAHKGDSLCTFYINRNQEA